MHLRIGLQIEQTETESGADTLVIWVALQVVSQRLNCLRVLAPIEGRHAQIAVEGLKRWVPPGCLLERRKGICEIVTDRQRPTPRLL